MGKKFKEFWKHDLVPEAKAERKDADNYEEMADEQMNSRKRSLFRQLADSHRYNARQLEDADTTYQVAQNALNNLPISGYLKSETIHSTKWDDCVAKVAKNNKHANAYAICTAELGESAFKSQYKDLAYVKSEIRKARKAVDTAFAGPIPNSLVAAQDLERETTEKNITPIAEKIAELAEKAGEANNTTEEDNIAEGLKSAQLKRQKTEINSRKSFKQAWIDNNNG